MSLVAVFDGHGGDLIAKMSAQRIVECIENNPIFKENAQGGSPEQLGEAMRAAFLKIDAEMRQIPAIASGEDQSGCTAIVGLITETHIIVANSGDSRGILFTGDSVEPMSYDHKPFNEIEQTRIEKAGGCVSMRRVNGDLAVSRAFGDYSYKQRSDMKAEEQQVSAEPDIKIWPRRADDKFLLLCCDGIWDVMSNEEAGKFMQQQLANGWTGMPLSTTCETLLDTCLEKGSRDNMSAVLACLPACEIGEGEGPPAEPDYEGDGTQTLKLPQ